MGAVARFAIAVFAVSLLAGCSSDPATSGSSPSEPVDPVVAAGEYCKDQVKATFDDPSTAAFGKIAGGGASDGNGYAFTSTVTGDGQKFTLTCTVTGAPGSFVLASFNLAAAE